MHREAAAKRPGVLTKVGLETGERVWRMPLGPEYDKQIDSQFADMKNTGGRSAGSVTAAQFAASAGPAGGFGGRPA